MESYAFCLKPPAVIVRWITRALTRACVGTSPTKVYSKMNVRFELSARADDLVAALKRSQMGLLNHLAKVQ